MPAGEDPEVAIAASGPTALCPGESVTLTASGADTYSWSTSASGASITVSTPGTYSVTGTNTCGQASASITVTASPGPVVAITGNLAICPGETTVLTASGAATYVWSTSAITPSITVGSAGTYTVTGTSACGQATATVTVQEGVAPVAAITGAGFLCPGETITLTASGGGTYLWNTSATTASISVDEAGTYEVEVTTGCGTATAQAVVTTVDLSAAFTASPLSGAAPLDVDFTSGTVPPGATHDWDLGDGTGSSSASPSNTYTAPGVYTVIHTVTALGCTVEAQLTVW